MRGCPTYGPPARKSPSSLTTTCMRGNAQRDRTGRKAVEHMLDTTACGADARERRSTKFRLALRMRCVAHSFVTARPSKRPGRPGALLCVSGVDIEASDHAVELFKPLVSNSAVLAGSSPGWN
jgi:hypothetical protein